MILSLYPEKSCRNRSILLNLNSLFLHSRIAPHVRDIPPSGIREFFDIVSTRDDIISLGVGEPDFATPWHIREAAITALEQGVTSYTSNYGMLSLRREIAKYVARRTGVDYNPENEVLITVGGARAGQPRR